MKLKYEIKNKADNLNVGGQQTNYQRFSSILECEDLNLEIKLNYYRKHIDNEELLKKILLFITEEINK